MFLAAVSPSMAEGELSSKQYVLDLGAGLMFQPRYPGTDEMIAVPFPLISVVRFYIPGVDDAVDGNAPVKRFSIYPSFGFNGSRDSSQSRELKGLKDVDWSVELGLGAAYRYDWIRGFVEVRQGFNGYSGQVAEFGVDFIANPTEDLQLMAGPRASWGSDDFMNTYFGVGRKEAAAPGSILDEYDAGAGFNRVGVAGTASYEFAENSTFHVRAGWDRIIGDAADSPIVKEGSVNQYYIGAGITYRFGFDLFQ
jgi:outer membrane scaffolding protein for murein synthesis (MipA/OmpV family)